MEIERKEIPSSYMRIELHMSKQEYTQFQEMLIKDLKTRTSPIDTSSIDIKILKIRFECETKRIYGNGNSNSREDCDFNVVVDG